MFCVSNITNPGRILLHWVSYVPMCFTCPSALRALRTYLHLCCTCPHAHVSLLLTPLCGYVLLYLTNLRACVSFSFTFLGTFAFPTYLCVLCAYVPELVLRANCVYSIMCLYWNMCFRMNMIAEWKVMTLISKDQWINKCGIISF